MTELQQGQVLWFSDAGEYPDRVWLESADANPEPGGQQLGIKVVSELQEQGLIEPDCGDPYRQRWRLVAE